jgi:hypothetical protein
MKILEWIANNKTAQTVILSLLGYVAYTVTR